jgi:hypothetical protein
MQCTTAMGGLNVKAPTASRPSCPHEAAPAGPAMNLPRRRFLVGLASLAMLTRAAATDPSTLKVPTGPTVLTIAGKIGVRNHGEEAVFEMDMLEALPGRKGTMQTPWEREKITFEGPLMSAVLDAVEAKGSTVLVTALNEYAAEIPVSDFRKWPVILATRKNGGRMTVREKGPLFIVYPFDAASELYNEVYFGRSVWQVKRMEVR